MNVPKLRFKEFDNEWKFLPIGDILRIKSGFGFKVSEYCDYGARLLQIENVGYGKINWNKNSCLPFDYLDKYPELNLKENDIVIALNRPVTNDQLKISKLTQNDEPSILYQRVGKLCFISESAQPNYIYQVFINYVKNFVLKQAIGSDQPFISITALYKYKIPLPSFPEQTKIANFLTAIDEKITQLTQKHDLLKQYKKGVMQQIFSQKLRFKDDEGREFPEWEELNFDEGFYLANNKKTQVKSSDYSETGHIPVVDQGQKWIVGYTSNEVVYDDVPVIIFGDHTRILKWIDFKFAPGADGIQVIKTTKKLNLKFGYYCLCNIELPNLGYSRHMKEMKEQYFFVPTCLNEQTKIANFLTAIDNKITQTQTQLEAVKQYKKGLLNRPGFTGDSIS